MSDPFRTGAGVIEALHDIVWIRGTDTIRFLDGLLSQDVAGMAEGKVAHSLLLAPNGKVRVPHVLWRGRDEVALVSGHGAGEIAAGDLRRFKIRVDVTIELEDRPVVAVVGERAAEVLERSGIEPPPDDGWRGGDVVVGAVPFAHGGPPRYVLAGFGAGAAAAAGGVLVDRSGFEALRIERGEALVGRDVGDSTIPQEMGAVDHAVSFTKGCYLGQELVARIDSRGHVNRQLRGILFDVGAMPAAGAELAVADKVVGELTSVAHSEAVGAPVGMALVRREVSPDDRVEVRWSGGETVGVVKELPFG